MRYRTAIKQCSCGKTFEGSSRTKYCRDCIINRQADQKKAQRAAKRERMKQNEMRQDAEHLVSSPREAKKLRAMEARQAKWIATDDPSKYRAASLAEAEQVKQSRNVAVVRENCLTGRAGAICQVYRPGSR